MKTSLMHRSILYFIVLSLLGSAGCSAIVIAPTPTPERAKIIDGEVEACSLLRASEVEAISGIQVTSQVNRLVKRASCGYSSVKDGGTVLVTYAYTEATVKRFIAAYTESTLKEMTLKQMAESPSPVEWWYETNKQGALLMHEKLPGGILKIENIDQLGDQAFFVIDTNLLRIEVLNNQIDYLFVTGYSDNETIDYEALLKLAKVALQRAP
jgi:hypothetical protein